MQYGSRITKTSSSERILLGGRFGYFSFFCCSGEGKGVQGAKKGAGGRFYIENPRRGGSPRREGEWGGAGRVSAGIIFFGGGGGGFNIFFLGSLITT